MDLSLYLITDESIGLGRSHTHIAEQALKGGATVIQLRDKEKSSNQLYLISLSIRRLTTKFGALFIVNDRLDIALASNADGVHLGKDDLPVSVARKVAGERLIIGASVSTEEEALQAQEEGATYLSVQSLFETTSKEGVKVVGPGRLKTIAGSSKIPVIAIGGINAGNLDQAINAGASGVAVISAIVGQKDIKNTTRRLKQKIDRLFPDANHRPGT